MKNLEKRFNEQFGINLGRFINSSGYFSENGFFGFKRYLSTHTKNKYKTNESIFDFIENEYGYEAVDMYTEILDITGTLDKHIELLETKIELKNEIEKSDFIGWANEQSQRYNKEVV